MTTTELTQAELAEIQAAQDAHDDELWSDEMAQLSWAERGGYAAGLPRPATRFYRATAEARACENEDIAF